MQSRPLVSAIIPVLLLGLGACLGAAVAPPVPKPPTPPPPPVADTAGPAEEFQSVDGKLVPVWAKKELSMEFKSKDVDDIKSLELWYASYDGKEWGPWQKHGIVFPPEVPITWTPPEGHWKIFVRVIKKSGLALPEPDQNTKPRGEFIIDRTPPTVAISFPPTKAKLRGGIKYAIKWEAADPHLRSAPVTIRWSRDGKGTYEVEADAIPNNGSFDWTVPKDMTTSGQLQIQVMDKAGNVGTAESGQILVDSINPHGRVLGPAISSKSEVNLDLAVADAGPAGLASARLWVSQDDGTSWTEGPFIQEPFKTVAWKATADGRFRLAVVAVDQAGNASATPKGKTDDQSVLIVDTTPPTILLSSAIGIVEAEKTASPRRAFKAGDRVAVPFVVKDANLAPNTVAVFLQTDPNKAWQELGRNLPADAAFRFEIPALGSRNARVKVQATDQAGNVGETVATETFVIDTDVDPGTVIIR
jgi:hypothetical protein